MAPAARKPNDSVHPDVLNAYLTTVQSDVSEIKATLSKLSDAITGIERLETRQIALVGEIESARKLQSDFENRVSSIEHEMPGLRELRRWVVGGMVTGIGMMLIAVASLVLSPRQYVILQPPQLAAVQTQPEVDRSQLLFPR